MFKKEIDKRRARTGVFAYMDSTQKALNRVKGREGFSLAETLLAVLILLLVSVVVATGMPAVTNAYNKVVLGANAKAMLSTAVTALHDEMGTAWQVKNSTDNKSLTYFNGSTGAQSIVSSGDKLPIKIRDYVPLSSDSDLIHDNTATKGEEYYLVSGEHFKPKMYVTYNTIQYSNGIVTISGLKVCKEDHTTLAEFSKEDGSAAILNIRVISEDSIT